MSRKARERLEESSEAEAGYTVGSMPFYTRCLRVYDNGQCHLGSFHSTCRLFAS